MISKIMLNNNKTVSQVSDTVLLYCKIISNIKLPKYHNYCLAV